MEIRKTDNYAYGESFFDVIIKTSKTDLTNKFGKPSISLYGDDEKGNYIWGLELADGTPFTIYDWKEGWWLCDDTEIGWHIGTLTRNDSEKVKQVLAEYGFEIM